MRRIRMQRPRARRAPSYREVLSLDSRDPDIRRAKALGRSAHASEKVASA